MTIAATVSPRADFVGALAWIAFGVAIVGGSLAMDRLERFGATAYTAPGLVPGLLGGLIALLGVLLMIRSLRRGALATLAHAWRPTAAGRSMLARSAIAIALTLLYTLGMVGRGLPFWLATAAFVFVFMLVFHVPEQRERNARRRGLAVAAIVAVTTSAVVTLVFERVFLVRMP